VRATIALARLIREKQPKLYDWLFQLRSKQKVMDQIRLLQPLVHISGRFLGGAPLCRCGVATGLASAQSQCPDRL
jgi:exonuclease I